MTSIDDIFHLKVKDNEIVKNDEFARDFES